MTGAAIPEELRNRDPEFIRAVLPTLWLAATVWFRAEVHGFDNVPDEPVLFVGNHSGGGATPDTFVLLLAYNTFFTVEGRPLYALAHDTITAAPGLGRLTRKLGVVPADNSFAEQIFDARRLGARLSRRRCRGPASVARPQSRSSSLAAPGS